MKIKNNNNNNNNNQSWHIIQLFTFEDWIYFRLRELHLIHINRWYSSTLAYLIHRQGMRHILQQYQLGSEYRWDQFSSLTSTLDLSYQNPTSCAPESFVYSLPGTEVYLLNDIFFFQGLNSELHPNTIPLQKSHIQAILHHLKNMDIKM